MSDKDYIKEEESSLFYFLRLVISNWKLLLSIYLTVGIVTVITLLVIPKWYKSEATIVILEDSSSPMNNMLSEFSAFGFNLGGGVNVETYIQYVHTKKMYDRIINEFNLMEVFEAEKRENAYDMIFENLGVNDNENSTFTISYVYKEDPLKAKQIVEFIYQELDRIALEVDQAQASNFRNYIEDYYQQTKQQLRTDEDSLATFQKQSGILSLDAQLEATIQGLAELELEKIKLEIERDYLQKSFQNTSKISDINYQIESISQKIEELKSVQNTSLVSINNIPDKGVEFLRIQRDIRVGSEVSEFLRLQYEQALLDEQKINSNLYMVDPPRVAEKRVKPQRTRVLFVVMFFTFLLSLILIRGLDFYHTNKPSINQLFR
jgi:uncharacterized protein involved in exopolysaccharide biosynthesis